MTSKDDSWKVIEFDEDEPTVLFHQYKGQTRPQPVYIEIDTEKKTISADWSGDTGNTEPTEGFDGQIIRFSIPPLTAKAANELMDCVKTILDETDLSTRKSAKAAYAKIADVIGEYQEAPQVEAWEAADWLEPIVNGEVDDQVDDNLAGWARPGPLGWVRKRLPGFFRFGERRFWQRVDHGVTLFGAVVDCVLAKVVVASNEPTRRSRNDLDGADELPLNQTLSIPFLAGHLE